jgi:hypothetical protein
MPSIEAFITAAYRKALSRHLALIVLANERTAPH